VDQVPAYRDCLAVFAKQALKNKRKND
jgi:hypothetical protein